MVILDIFVTFISGLVKVYYAGNLWLRKLTAILSATLQRKISEYLVALYLIFLNFVKNP